MKEEFKKFIANENTFEVVEKKKVAKKKVKIPVIKIPKPKDEKE